LVRVVWVSSLRFWYLSIHETGYFSKRHKNVQLCHDVLCVFVPYARHNGLSANCQVRRQGTKVFLHSEHLIFLASWNLRGLGSLLGVIKYELYYGSLFFGCFYTCTRWEPVTCLNCSSAYESSTGNLVVKAVIDSKQMQYRRQTDGRSHRVSNVGSR